MERTVFDSPVDGTSVSFDNLLLCTSECMYCAAALMIASCIAIHRAVANRCLYMEDVPPVIVSTRFAGDVSDSAHRLSTLLRPACYTFPYAGCRLMHIWAAIL